MKLSIIIVSYNVRYYLEQCLLSVEKATAGIDAEVIVFDNHSHDDSVAYLSSRFPKVSFIASNHNIGFAKANNRAIRQSLGEYVLLLNPDTVVGEHTLRDAVAFMDAHPDAGAAGVRMLKADGGDAMESRRGIPTPLTAFYKMSGLCTRFPHNHRLGKYYMSYLPWDQPERIEIVSGAFCLLRRKALDEVGLLDEDFFMYGEDIDLSYRLLKGGWHNWYLPTKILHYKGESTKKSSFRYVHVFYESMLIFFRKHYGHLSWLLSVPIKSAIYSKAMLALVSMLLQRVHRMLGFVGNQRPDDALFMFFVSPSHLKASQDFVRHKGLWAEFHDANKEVEADDTVAASGQTAYVVYDVTAYTYEEILARMSASHHRLQVAFYYPDRKMVIAPREALLLE